MVSFMRTVLLLVVALFIASCDTPVSEKPVKKKVEIKPNTVEHYLVKGRQSGKQPNRLINESSPYLLQHAYNPVEWYAWGNEAFEQARKQNKPVFLSIGYSTCHWCHVMARESFENAEIAALLNEHFISIKVDREERPDIDSVYMAATEMINGYGGWPMTVFLNQDLEPFHATTYMPPFSTDEHSGLKELLLKVVALWRDESEQLNSVADQIATLIKSQADHAVQDVAIHEDIVARAYSQITESFDDEHGGFGDAPKFPSPGIYALLGKLSKPGEPFADEARHILKTSLDAMADGGIHDHVGGGFHRYSVDAQWQVPHFEKMLYTQALMAIAYIDLYELEKNGRYREIVNAIMAFVLRELRDQSGGFYAALDAESARPDRPGEKAEGVYYLWSAAELQQLVPAQAWRLVSNHYNIHDDGNIDLDPYGEFEGLNIFYVNNDDGQYTLSEQQQALLQEAINALADARMKRPQPHLDDKIITAWNGMMITALARASDVFYKADYKVYALKAAEYIKHTALDQQTYDLFRQSRLGNAGVRAGLDDYVWYVKGLLSLYRVTGDRKWLNLGVKLTERQIEFFHDEINGGFFESREDEHVLFRSKSAYDGALPSANAIALDNLQALFRLTRNKKWQQLAEQTAAVFGATINANPPSAAWMLSVMP